MAERRMVAISLIDDDGFLDLPQGAQLLYFHLSMRADDDGFITPKKVMRLVNAKQKDLDSLIDAGFLLNFDSGVVVITHWRMCNSLRKDRYNPTAYQEEFSQLKVINGKYERYDGKPEGVEVSLDDEERGNQMATNETPESNQDGNQMATSRQTLSASGKDRLGKERESTPSTSVEVVPKRKNPTPTQPGNQTPPTLSEVQAYFGANCLFGNPEKFFSRFTSTGWINSHGQAIRDWKARAREWSIDESSRSLSPGKNGIGSSGGKPRDYDGSYDTHGMKEVMI